MEQDEPISAECVMLPIHATSGENILACPKVYLPLE